MNRNRHKCTIEINTLDIDFFYYGFITYFYDPIVDPIVDPIIGPFAASGFANGFGCWVSKTLSFGTYFNVWGYFRKRVKFFKELFTAIIVF